jgi:cysteine desulfurase / selenocysteine lyase
MEEVGADAVHARNRVLSDRLRLCLAERGLTPHDPGPAGRSAIVTVPLPPERLEDATARLQTHGVAAAVRGGSVRFAVHFYNDEDNIDCAARALT